ncbi:winged helix-turn-helix domain-containing protein [Undibacterium luofuense]|uniref:ArsR/SmtB family transcription factor n=1 Tax=Undibacterium luofuense TaxID=2828733 RepID=UPI0030EF5D45
MKDGPNIVAIAALIGDHARAEVLTALMSGMALTATELAEIAGVTRQTISSHMTKLLEAGLVEVEAQGRHRYFRLANEDVAQLLESLMNVAFRSGAVRLRSSPREPALRKARVCYNHLAGELGVLVYEQLLQAGCLTIGEQGMALTPHGRQAVQGLGIAAESLKPSHRPLCRHCLDWSERRHHLAGVLGAVLLRQFEALDWAKRQKDSRVMAFSASGEQSLRCWLASLSAQVPEMV